jgi:hypothetical protein
LLATVQLVFEVILNVFVLLAVAATPMVVADRLRLAVAASWVTIIVLSATPVPDIVIIAVLVAAKVLAVAVKVITPLLKPLAVPTVNHAWLLATVQLVFEVMLKLAVLFAADATLKVVVDRLRLAVAASCVTIMVLSVTPVPDTVIVAILVAAKVLADAVKVIAPLLEPLEVPTVNHAWLLLTVQLVFEVILKIAVLFAADATLKVVNDILRLAVAASWVTVMVLSATPVPDTVIVAVLVAAKVLADAVRVMAPLLEPETVPTVNHAWLLDTVQFVFEVILKLAVLLAADATLNIVADRLRLAVAAS